MAKKFEVYLFIFFWTLSPFRLSASPQMPDYIIFKGDTIATYNLILEQYFQLHEKTESEKLFGLSFRNSTDGSFSFSCWRGYQAIYKIENDSLFLVDIINCGERRNGKISKAVSIEKIKGIFNDKLINDRVFINWFSGDMNFPLNNRVLRWDGVFYKIYENETVINITNGKVLKVEAVENYVDDPKRINRKEKDKISDILFKKLKKVKWKNEEKFDCSDKYLITIDENGNISKVRMLYTDVEVEKYHEKDEYNFCINKIYNAIKTLKFDIIKDKGKPIPEDVYIEIWIEDNGKIENWTD